MARQKLTIARDMRYGTRMLTAGEPVEMSGPDARLFGALGWAKPLDEEALPDLKKDELKDVAEREGVEVKSNDTKDDIVEKIAEARDPLDHDGDGKKGGSAKGKTSTRAKGKAKKAAE